MNVSSAATNCALVLGTSYLAQLSLKAALAARYGGKLRSLAAVAREDEVTLVQPILSGDPALEETLLENVLVLKRARFLWLVDTDDAVGLELCGRISLAHRERLIEIIPCPPPPQGINPKAHKLALALCRVATPSFVVLDDDTRLSAAALSALLNGLDTGASLATGLPRYRAARGNYSSWLAEFVNSAAILTYLPALNFTAPLSIQGMCYAMRTAEARRLDLFAEIARCLTDDLALAHALHCRNLRICQTVEPHDIATSVSTFRALRQILHRWFVFTRLLLDELPLRGRAAIALAYAVPPLMLAALCVAAVASLSALGVLMLTLAFRAVVLGWVRRRFLGPQNGGLSLVSIIMELAQPAMLAASCLRTKIVWRTRVIRVRSVDQFEYL
ncbi:MAG TPA: glycosyltransferase [Opitutaceae bacterium]|nr:glycosyltransferase [Opitutaceae bacterium]